MQVKKIIFNTCFLLWFVILFSACENRHGEQIAAVIPLVQNHPDSVLKVLNSIDRRQLSEKNQALYSLVYTMAQDKSGLDVRDDSLMRYAYNWYHEKPNDSLYAKCEYYMGRFFQLNDSSEKALNCYSNSIKACKQHKDYYTQCLALEKMSIIVREYDADLAIRYAKECVSLYNMVENGPNKNMVYALLNLADCYAYKENQIKSSIIFTKKAIQLAATMRDSSAVANCYQDLSVIYNMSEQKENSLKAAKQAVVYSKRPNPYLQLCLANAYNNVDSLKQASRIAHELLSINKTDFKADIFYMLTSIALKSHNYKRASSYTDSLATSLQSLLTANSKAKDKYYHHLIEQEKTKAKFQEESQIKTGFIWGILILSALALVLIVYISRSKKKRLEMLNQEQQAHKQMIIEHQQIQITTMREYLMRKLEIQRKLDALKEGDSDKLIMSDDDWKDLEAFLNTSSNDFVLRLSYNFPSLTKKDLRFLMLIKIKLSYPVIASIFNIEVKSVKQKLFLLKRKLGLKNSQKSTREFIESY